LVIPHQHHKTYFFEKIDFFDPNYSSLNITSDMEDAVSSIITGKLVDAKAILGLLSLIVDLLSQVNNKNQERVDLIEASNSKIAQLKAENIALEAENIALKKQLDVADNKFKDMKSIAAKHSSEAQSLQNSVNQLQEAYATACRQCYEHLDHIRKLEAALVDANKKVAQLATHIEAKMMEHAKLQHAHSLCEDSYSDLQSNFSELLSENEALKKTNELNMQFSTNALQLRDENAKLLAKLSDMEKLHASKAVNCIKLENELTARRNMDDQNQAMISILKQEIALLRK